MRVGGESYTCNGASGEMSNNHQIGSKIHPASVEMDSDPKDRKLPSSGSKSSLNELVEMSPVDIMCKFLLVFFFFFFFFVVVSGFSFVLFSVDVVVFVFNFIYYWAVL